MPTREQVTAAIKAIEDNGKNTALEVRNTLTALLEFTETVPKSLPPEGGNDVPFFHFSSDPYGIDQDGFIVWYSFKGIKEQTVNFTLRILTRDESINEFKFDIKEEEFNVLKSIYQSTDEGSPIYFAIPVHGRDNMEKMEIEVLKFHLKAPTQIILSLDGKLHLGSAISIFTSVHFHAPKFIFDTRE